MDTNLNEIVTEFAGFLERKYHYLTRIKLFLVGVPELFTDNKINQVEFQNFMDKYELETARYLSEKNWYQEKIAEHLNIKKEQVNFKLLVNLGFSEFEDKGRNVLRISNEITLLLFKIAVYMKNYLKLQREFSRLNTFLDQKDYSPRGVQVSVSPGRNFYGEA